MTEGSTLTADQVRSLRCLVGMMIPASSTYNVPGAADGAIFADILRGFGRDTARVRAAMDALDALAGGVFADLDAERRRDVAARFREVGGAPLAALTRIVLQCYYRDDRVMRSLDLEVRPPFPKGFEVEQGDWSLLEPVWQRGRMYRAVD